MEVMLSSNGLPLLTSARLVASRMRSGALRPGPIDLGEPVSQFTYRGVTVTLSTPLPVYHSATGDPVIIADKASSITSITPASALVDGYAAHGAMIDPVDPSNTLGQGFDEIIGTTTQGGTLAYAYRSDLNVDPGSTGAPIAIEQGAAFSIVKAVRVSGATAATFKPVERYVVVTVMPAPPPGAGRWFRPSVSNPAKAWEHRVEDLDFRTLRTLAAPAGLGSCASYLAEIEAQNTLTLPLWRSTGEAGRRSQINAETGTTGYSRDHGRRRGEYALSLHVDPAGDPAAIAARRALATILVQHGIDVDGTCQAGYAFGSGAGQYYGHIVFPYLAAFMLGDAGMVARARTVASNSIGQCFWVTSREIGYPVSWDVGSIGGSQKNVGETYQSMDLDIPDWTHTGWQEYAEQPDNLVGLLYIANASLYGAYRDTIFTTHIYEMLGIGLLQNGPSGETGDAAIRDGAYGPRNIRSAALAYLDRSVTFEPWKRRGVEGHSADSLALYHAWRDEIPQPRWTGRPDVPMSVEHPDFAAGSGSGEISFDCTGKDYATEPVTSRDLAYSQDGLQFVSVSGVGTTHILAGLRPGTQHWCRWRQTSASGTGRWSPTWEMCLESGTSPANYKVPRGLVTTPGAASGTLANAVPPAVLHKPYPNQAMPYFEPVADATNVLTFHAGMGYWTGGTGALSATYRWQRDNSGGGSFADIPGATGQSYARQAADSGCRIRCVVSVRDSAATPASVTVATNAVGIPAPASYPAGTVIDIDFDGESLFDWPAFWAALTAADAASAAIDLIHLHGVQMDPALTRGTLRIRKTGSHPTLDVEVTPGAPDGTYNWQVEIGGGYFPASSTDTAMQGDIQFRLRDAAGAVRGDATLDIPREDAPIMVSASGTFTIGGADKSIRLFVKVPISGGGVGGTMGGPILSKLKIWKS